MPPRCTCPEILDKARWQQDLRETWLSDEDVFLANDEVNVEVEWNWFNAKLEIFFLELVLPLHLARGLRVACLRFFQLLTFEFVAFDMAPSGKDLFGSFLAG